MTWTLLLLNSLFNRVASDVMPLNPLPHGLDAPVHLMACFDYPHLFHTVECCVYGQREAVRLMSVPLVWKPLGDWLLFIFAITSRGPIVLMSSDLTLSPTTAIELYCMRTRIEIMFSIMKNIIGAFRFHFWTKTLPRHSRRPTANRHLKVPRSEHLSYVPMSG